MTDGVWRHVTTRGADGSVRVATEQVAPRELLFQPGFTAYPIWGEAAPGASLSDGPEHAPFFPAAGASRFVVARFAGVAERVAAEHRAAELGLSRDELRADAERALPGLFDVQVGDGEISAVHTTASIDYSVVLRGEISLYVGGRRTLLSPGHCVVQGGVEHAWVNEGAAEALIAFVLIGT